MKFGCKEVVHHSFRGFWYKCVECSTLIKEFLTYCTMAISTFLVLYILQKKKKKKAAKILIRNVLNFVLFIIYHISSFYHIKSKHYFQLSGNEYTLWQCRGWSTHTVNLFSIFSTMTSKKEIFVTYVLVVFKTRSTISFVSTRNGLS